MIDKKVANPISLEVAEKLLCLDFSWMLDEEARDGFFIEYWDDNVVPGKPGWYVKHWSGQHWSSFRILRKEEDILEYILRDENMILQFVRWSRE